MSTSNYPTLQSLAVLKLKEFLSVEDTARLLGISKRTVFRLLEKGELKAGKVGSRTIIPRSEVDRFFLLNKS